MKRLGYVKTKLVVDDTISCPSLQRIIMWLDLLMATTKLKSLVSRPFENYDATCK